MSCPADQELRDFLVGKLDDAWHEEMVAHVDACPACQQAVQCVSVEEDSFISDLRSEAPSVDEEPECRAVVRRLQAQRHDPASVEVSVRRIPPGGAPSIERIGPYQVLEKLGSGGMGTVYRAEHTKLKRDVALKILSAELTKDAQTVARFEREMQAIGQLDHPNIVQATDAGQRDGHHYLAMELVEGVNLSQLVRQKGPLNVQDACEIIRQVAYGLAYAHERELIHRDIKPSNLMLTRSSSGGLAPASSAPTRSAVATVKILDLGLALLSEEHFCEQLTSTHQVMGTPDYLAPEQWEDTRRVDNRADLYSLGCTLFFLLTGRAPFQDRNHASIPSKMRAHLHEAPPDIRRLRRDVPASLHTIMSQLLAKSPTERFSDATKLAKALESLADEAELDALALSTFSDPMSATLIATGGIHFDSTFTAASTPSRPSLRKRFVRWELAAIAAVAMVAAGVMTASLWSPIQRNETRLPQTSVSARQPPLAVLDFHVTHFRYDQQQQVQTRIGRVEEQLEPVGLGDEARVEVCLNRPAWCYLLALNPNGTIQQCYPSRNQPARPTATFHWPSEPTSYFRFTDSPGQQAFVLLVTDVRLPTWWAGSAPGPPDIWKPTETEGVWTFDGSDVKQVFPADERPRGEIIQRRASEFESLCSYFHGRPHFDAVQAVAFAVR